MRNLRLCVRVESTEKLVASSSLVGADRRRWQVLALLFVCQVDLGLLQRLLSPAGGLFIVIIAGCHSTFRRPPLRPHHLLP